MAGELRCRDRDVSQLLDCQLRDYSMIGHKQNAFLTIAGIFDFENLATGSRGGLRRYFDDLEQGPQNAADILIRAGDKAVGFMHGDIMAPK
jgi:hypothetical protein